MGYIVVAGFIIVPFLILGWVLSRAPGRISLAWRILHKRETKADITILALFLPEIDARRLRIRLEQQSALRARCAYDLSHSDQG